MNVSRKITVGNRLLLTAIESLFERGEITEEQLINCYSRYAKLKDFDDEVEVFIK